MSIYEDDLPSEEGYKYENVVTSQELAEKQFRCLKYWQEEERMVIEHYHKELDRIKLWRDHKINRIAEKKRWHEHGLQLYLEQNGKKSMDLVHGKVSKVTGREVVEVEDKDKFNEWFLSAYPLKEDKFYINKRTPSLDLIKQYVKETGEIPEGCKFYRKPDQIKVKVKEDAPDGLPLRDHFGKEVDYEREQVQSEPEDIPF